MERALVVIDGRTGDEQLLEEAGELAAGVNGDLVVLSITPEEEYQGRRQSRKRAGGHTHSIDQATEDARQKAESLARQVLGDLDIEYESVGSVGEPTDRILDVANNHGCDHVFLVGRRRSPTGKAIFGDIAQTVLLSFDGPVTVLMEEAVTSE